MSDPREKHSRFTRNYSVVDLNTSTRHSTAASRILEGSCTFLKMTRQLSMLWWFSSIRIDFLNSPAPNTPARTKAAMTIAIFWIRYISLQRKSAWLSDLISSWTGDSTWWIITKRFQVCMALLASTRRPPKQVSSGSGVLQQHSGTYYIALTQIWRIIWKQWSRFPSSEPTSSLSNIAIGLNSLEEAGSLVRDVSPASVRWGNVSFTITETERFAISRLRHQIVKYAVSFKVLITKVYS